MKKSHLLRAVCACSILFSSNTYAVAISGQGTWETTLLARDFDGDTNTIEGWYDTALNITWLADANFAMTSGFDSDGAINWSTANLWTTNLDIHGITGWRLPTVASITGASFNLGTTTDGTTDFGTARATTDGTDGGWRDSSGNPVSEMGNMYYVTLGNIGLCDPSLPFCTHQPGWGMVNTGSFSNIQMGIHWTDVGMSTDPSRSFIFDNSIGGQGSAEKDIFSFAWAVHDGDIGVAAVPVPAAAWLFGSGLLGLIGLARRKKAA